MISDHGLIEDFTIDGNINNSFPQLPKKREVSSFQQWESALYFYFGVYDEKFLYYISCDVEAFVIRHEIDGGPQSHIEIPGSKIPNVHQVAGLGTLPYFVGM